MTRSTLFLLGLLLLTACDSSDPLTQEPSATAVWVANGGNFSDQNGSLSRVALSPTSAEQGPAMDGFIQAVEAAGDELIVLINTFSGGRIDIVAADGRTVRASIPDIDAPRAVAIEGDRAYVTTFAFDGSGSVLTLDLPSGTLVGTPMPTGSYPEGIAIASSRLLVANAGFIGAGTTLTAISLADGSSQSIELACEGPRDVVVLFTGDVAVTCLGKTVYNDDFSQVLERTNGQVVFVAGESLAVQDRVEFDTQLGSTGAGQAAAASLDHLLVLEGATSTIHRVDLATRTAVSPWTLDDQGAYVGVSGIARSADGWFVGRLARAAGGPFPDYTASGQVVILDDEGVVKDVLTVGPAPTHITLKTD
jgi:hypothetical protein